MNGILNQSNKVLPHPATYLMDKNGIVRWQSVDVDYRLLPANQQTLEALKAIR
jgi:peroxiredoxin